MKNQDAERRNPLSEYPPEERNKIIGEAIDAWLEKKWAAFGKWTARGISAGVLGYIVYFLTTHGWPK